MLKVLWKVDNKNDPVALCILSYVQLAFMIFLEAANQMQKRRKKVCDDENVIFMWVSNVKN